MVRSANEGGMSGVADQKGNPIAAAWRGFVGIFLNRSEKRLRAGWRILIQLFLFFGMLVGLSFATKPLGHGPEAAIIGSFAYIAGGLGLAWLLARFLDK